jgi:hypothetical protein
MTHRNTRQRTKSGDSSGYMSANDFSSIIQNSQKVEKIQLFISRRMDKQNVVYNRMEYYSALKRGEILIYAMV